MPRQVVTPPPPQGLIFRDESGMQLVSSEKPRSSPRTSGRLSGKVARLPPLKGSGRRDRVVVVGSSGDSTRSAIGPASGRSVVLAPPLLALDASPRYGPSGEGMELVPVPGPSGGNEVTVWPSTRNTRRQLQLECQRVSKAPFALQLEAFIRKEHRQYLLEHPDCARADTLHIFREAFGAFVDHFTEYRSLLHLIRDEYDAALMEMEEQVKRMKVIHLENKSDRSLHAIELTQIKETLNATISNQQAQLHAAQSLVHALRDQVATAEHANSLLRNEMERKLSEHDEAQEQVKLLSRAMIEESARGAEILAESGRKDNAMSLMAAKIKVLTENLEELDNCLREQARQQMMSATSMTTRPSKIPPLKSVQDDVEEERTYSDQYVLSLLQRIDRLEFRLVESQQEVDKLKEAVAHRPLRTPKSHVTAPSVDNSNSGFPAAEQYENIDVKPLPIFEEPAQFAAGTLPGALGSLYAANSIGVLTNPKFPVLDPQFPIIRDWLRGECIDEKEVESTDWIIPSGWWSTEDTSFLKACEPVHNRHLTLFQVRELIDDFWTSREEQMGYTKLRPFMLEWLIMQAGTPGAARELGVNLIQGCQLFYECPYCRSLLQILRGFLPEEAALAYRRSLKNLLRSCEITTDTTTRLMSIDTLFTQIRSAFPDKSAASILQLRFYVHRQVVGDEPTEVDLNQLFAKDSRFLALLCGQFFKDIELFTLQVVEGIRRVGDARGNGTVMLNRVKNVFRELDPGLSDEVICRYVAEGSKRTILDTRNADETLAVKMEPLLKQYRTTILLRRASPYELK